MIVELFRLLKIVAARHSSLFLKWAMIIRFRIRIRLIS
nr:MAG TPA: hypothetical protein [Bacteriophage sp.]